MNVFKYALSMEQAHKPGTVRSVSVRKFCVHTQFILLYVGIKKLLLGGEA